MNVTYVELAIVRPVNRSLPIRVCSHVLLCEKLKKLFYPQLTGGGDRPYLLLMDPPLVLYYQR